MLAIKLRHKSNAFCAWFCSELGQMHNKLTTNGRGTHCAQGEFRILAVRLKSNLIHCKYKLTYCFQLYSEQLGPAGC